MTDYYSISFKPNDEEKAVPRYKIYITQDKSLYSATIVACNCDTALPPNCTGHWNLAGVEDLESLKVDVDNQIMNLNKGLDPMYSSTRW